MFTGEIGPGVEPYGFNEERLAATAAKELEIMRNPTITERLKRQKAELERRLAEINIVLQTLETNPEIQKVVDAVSKIRGI